MLQCSFVPDWRPRSPALPDQSYLRDVVDTPRATRYRNLPDVELLQAARNEKVRAT